MITKYIKKPVTLKIDKFYLLDQQNRFIGIEGIRGIASIMIFCSHFLNNHYKSDFYTNGNILLLNLFRTLQSGHFGVDMFFMVSSFLLFRSYLKKEFHFFQFIEKRYRRLLPAHVFALFVVIMLGAGLGLAVTLIISALSIVLYNNACMFKKFAIFEKKFFRSCFVCTAVIFFVALFATIIGDKYLLKTKVLYLSGNMFFLSHFFMGIKGIRIITWALWIELLFYYTFPLILFFVKKKKYVLILILFLFLYFSQWSVADLSSQYGIIWIRFERCIPFLSGLFLAVLYENKTIWLKLEPYFHRISIICLPLTLMIMYAWGKFMFLRENDLPFYRLNNAVYFAIAALLFLFILGGSLIKNSFVYMIFSNKLLRILGSVSYSMYLIHIIIINQTYPLFAPYSMLRMIIHFVISLLLSFAAVSIVYYTFERKYFKYN